MFIDIDGIDVEVLRKNVKNMTLRVYPPNGDVRVSVPLRYGDKLIKQHLQTKSVWIRAQQERMREKNPGTATLLQTGATIPFKGKNYLLIIKEHMGPFQIKLSDELMYFYLKPNTTELQRQTILDRWYKREMELIIPELVLHWEALIHVKTTQWGIKKMKTRWGSCNTRAHRIWLNLKLIQKPMVCLEYVLVHELIHLLEASHNQRFYALMAQFMPNWREHQQLLEL